MLAPHDRQVILHALRPPGGYRLDRAIATTYTLDLVALLLAPLAFSLFDAAADREKSVDSLALIRAVREHSSRISVFCQAEGIACPARYPLLAQYLEGSIVPVKAPNDAGVFHVKLWVLRFVADGAPVRYRVLVPSRNLTFDRSWDTLLVLDGTLADRQRAFARNHPLADFVAALPSLALTPPNARVANDCVELAEELRRVDFELPEGFDELAFFPLGYGGKQRDPFDERMERLLVISPFVSSARLRSLSEGVHALLVSRLEWLARLSPSTLGGFSEGVFVLDEAATPDEDEDSEDEVTLALPERPPPHGLHAKVYVADAGWDAHVWTGSANATDAAFGQNVELLVKLTGRKGKVGIERMLDEGNPASLRALLRAYTATDADNTTPEPIDPELDRAARVLATLRWRAAVRAASDGLERYSVTLSAAGASSATAADVVAWPITLPRGRARAWDGGPLTFDDCSLEALTPFFALHVTVAGDDLRSTTLVVQAELDGAPEHRGQRLLQNLFHDPRRLVQFLELMLSTDPLRHLTEEHEAGERSIRNGQHGGSEPPLFELLMRALARNPYQLDHMKTLLDEIRGTSGDHPLLDQEFDRIWQPIWQAHVERRGRV